MKALLLYFVFISTVCFLAFTDLLWSDNTRFLILSALVVIYNMAELRWLYKTNSKYFFINPIMLAVIANFFAYLGGMSNFLLLDDGIYMVDPLAAPLNDERYWLNYTMAYVCLASVFMWLGYKLSAGRKLSSIVLNTFKYKLFLGSNLRFGLIVFLAVVGYLLKVYLLQIGLFGRLIDESVSATGNTTSFVYSQTRFLRSFSIVPFVLIALMYFKHRTYRLRILFIVVFLLEFFFAAITGARGPIVVLSLLVFLTYYYNSQKLKSTILLYVGLSFYLAFTIVMQFKDFTHATDVVGLSATELLDNFKNYRANLSEAQQDRIYGAILYNFATRLNFVDEAAMAIRYKNVEGMDASDPDFVKPLYMIPVDIFVPKFIQGTPNVSWGLWFKRKVYKQTNDLIYNIAFSPIGYLYIAGGPLLIFIGFFTYGILLKAAYQFLDQGLIGFLVFMVLLASLAEYKTGVSVVYVGFFRAIIIMPILFSLGLKRIQLK